MRMTCEDGVRKEERSGEKSNSESRNEEKARKYKDAQTVTANENHSKNNISTINAIGEAEK